MKEVVIQNLKCGGCANTVTKGLEKLDGISNVQVNVEESKVSFESAQEDLSAVLQRLSELGYPEESEANSFLKKSKSVVSCVVGRAT